MSLINSIRNKLSNKVFDRLASTAYILDTTVSGGDYGGYTEQTETVNTETEIKAVPYNLFTERLNVKPFGDLNEGDMILILPYTYEDDISLGTKIKYDNTTYVVKQIEKWVLSDSLIAFACVLTKDLLQDL